MWPYFLDRLRIPGGFFVLGSAAPAMPSSGQAAGTLTHDTVAEVKQPERIPALDGIRGLAIFLVLIWHTEIYRLQPAHHPMLARLMSLNRLAWSGVDLFFVLSGFLIGGILLDARESPAYFKTFYLRRAYRILPLYFLAIAVSWTVFHASAAGLISPELAGWFKGRVPWWASLTFTQNIWMAAIGGFQSGVLRVSWSLAVEEQFYLSLPFLLRWMPRRFHIRAITTVIFAAPIIRALLIRYYVHGLIAAYVLIPCRADSLCLGVLVALMVRDPRTFIWLKSNRKIIYSAAGVLWLVLFLVAQQYEMLSSNLYGTEYSLLAMFYTCLLVIAITREDRFVKTFFCNRALMWLGTIAYGIYLIHPLLIDTYRALLIPVSWRWSAQSSSDQHCWE